MKESIYDYDPAAALDTEEAIVIFISDAFESGSDVSFHLILP